MIKPSSHVSTFAQLGGINSSETEVAPSGLSSPTSVEVSLPEQLSEFLSCGVKRKALDAEDEAGGNRARQQLVGCLTQSCEDAVAVKRRTGRQRRRSPGSPKSNILLAQLLSKQIDNDSPTVGEKDLSAIATVTPLMQMLQQCGGAIAGGGAKVDALSYARKLEADEFGAKKEPYDAPEFVGVEARSDLLSFIDSEIDGVLQRPKLENGGCEENVGKSVGLQKTLEFDVDDDDDDEDSKWEDFAGFGRLDKTGDKKNRDPTERGGDDCAGRTAPDLRDELLPKTDQGSQSEEDKKILAELEEALESSKFTMEDLNSIFILSSSLALEPTMKTTTKSTLNVLEEQVSRIDSEVLPLGAVNEGGPNGANGRHRAMPNYRCSNRELNDLVLMSEFDELITAPNSQKYSSQMQECQIPGEEYTCTLLLLIYVKSNIASP